MRADPYAGTDLLADVFPGTEDAPLPVCTERQTQFAAAMRFEPNPDDDRWKPHNGDGGPA